jgi:hypothetical protein
MKQRDIALGLVQILPEHPNLTLDLWLLVQNQPTLSALR